ncbi:unnamed protein product [Rotaria sordida]|nr:unnamed protein product [Rotaria sordida]
MATATLPHDDIPTNADDPNLEIFCLVWLDANVNVKDFRDTEQKLRSIINRFKKFQDVEQCRKYIERRSQKDRLVIIASGRLGRELVPSIHKLRQVISIYVYCMDKKSNKEWANKFSKIKDVVVDLDGLITRIKADHKTQRKVEEPLAINIFTTSFGKGKSTSGVNGKFVFSQVFIDCLLRLKSTETDKIELIDRCKQQYEGNSTELKNISEFEKTYSPDKVLWWYSRESFFYNTLNAVLRNEKSHMIFLFRSFISDIYHQLKKYQITQQLQVYRCQMISSDELETLKQSMGQFVSVNSFFSTSAQYTAALAFLKIHQVKDNLEPVLFEITADPNVATTKPFADISKLSDYSEESEVLFMLGSIFRLNSVNRSSDDRLWIIQMTLCSENEHDLKNVLKHMKQQLGTGETTLRTLGKVLWTMGKLDLAEQYFTRFLKEFSPNDPLLGNLYDELGELASQSRDYEKSVQWHQKALVFKNQQQLTPNSNINQTTNVTKMAAPNPDYDKSIQQPQKAPGLKNPQQLTPNSNINKPTNATQLAPQNYGHDKGIQQPQKASGLKSPPQSAPISNINQPINATQLTSQNHGHDKSIQQHQKASGLKNPQQLIPNSNVNQPPNATVISNTPVGVQWAQDGVVVAGGYGNGHTSVQFCFPHGLFVDDDQTMVIADNGNDRIVQWKVGDQHGKMMAGDRGPGNRLNQLNQPTDVIIDKATNSFIICDGDNRRLLRWSRQNDTNQGEILLEDVRCYGLAMDDQKNLYISDTKHHEVRRYQLGDKKGTVVAGGNGKGTDLNQLSTPTYIFVDQHQTVYVSERHNHRVTKWNKGATAGIVVAGGQGQGQALTQLSQPEGLFVDKLGTVYVVDSFNNRVMCWPQGAKQGTIVVGGNGRGQGTNQLNGPVGLAFDRHRNLYVADCGNDRVLQYPIV